MRHMLAHTSSEARTHTVVLLRQPEEGRVDAVHRYSLALGIELRLYLEGPIRPIPRPGCNGDAKGLAVWSVNLKMKRESKEEKLC